jgi:tRNA U54 and U55 pseudouridine synthase Pus10
MTTPAVLLSMKAGEAEKRKRYRAICWCCRALSEVDVAMLNAVEDLQLAQSTPARVMHRRAALTRERVCKSLRPD